MTWSNTSLIPVVVWYETWDVPGLYLPQNQVHTAIHQAKISLGPNTSTQLVSFKNVPNTSTSPGMGKKKKSPLVTRTNRVCSKVDTSTTLVLYLCDGWWSSPMIDTLYLFPLPPNTSLQTCQYWTCLEWPKQRVKTVQFSRPVVLPVRFGENLFKEWELLRKLSYFGLLLGFWELGYVLSVPGTSVFCIKFVRWVAWWSLTRWLCQIWLQGQRGK
jgi:hypothetical protein